MEPTYLFVLALAVTIHQSHAGMFDSGKCPANHPMKGFQASKFTGEWYIISFKPNMMESKDLTCRKTKFEVVAPDAAGNNIRMTASDVLKGVEKTKVKTAVWNEKDGGKMMMKQGMMVAPFTILDTDYDTYSLSWSCVDIGFMGHVEVKWIWSRTKTLSPAIKEKLLQQLKSFGIKTEMIVVDQIHC